MRLLDGRIGMAGGPDDRIKKAPVVVLGVDQGGDGGAPGRFDSWKRHQEAAVASRLPFFPTEPECAQERRGFSGWPATALLRAGRRLRILQSLFAVPE